MSGKHRVVSIGECMIELAPQKGEAYRRGFAGDTLNMAVYFARVASDDQSIHYATALGDDPFSQEMLSQWQQEGIQTDFVQIRKGKLPGLYLIRNDEKGERFFYFYRSQSAARGMFEGEVGDHLAENLLQFDTLYFSGITLGMLYPADREKLFSVLRKAHQKKLQIVFDSNYRAALWKDIAEARENIEKAQRFSSMVLPSFLDEQILFDDETPEKTALRLQQWDVQEVVVKLGSEGYLLSTVEGVKRVAIKPVKKVIDTTGAGDSFNGVYLAKRLQGLRPIEAAEKAAEIAGKVIAYPGAIIPKDKA